MGRRSDGLYRRGDHWYHKWKSIDGVWHERATRTRDYAEARIIRNKFLAELAAGKQPTERARWTLQQAVEHWLASRKYRIAKSSWASERTITKSLLRVLGSERRLQTLANIDVIRKYENDRLIDEVSTKSVNNELIVLAGILREAKLWRWVEPDYTPLRVKRSDIPGALTREEGYRLLQAARTCGEDSVAPLVAVLAFVTGMRSKEIRELQLGAISLDGARPQLQVRRRTTKTNGGVRFVALDSIACWALQKLINRSYRLGASQPEHYLLPTRLDRHTRANDPLHGGAGWDVTHPQTSWDAEWNRVRNQAQIKHRRFHDLRHTYITRAAETRVPLMVIQSQVGHMSKGMIELYCHIADAAVHNAAQLIEQHNPDLLFQLGLSGVNERERTSSEPRSLPHRQLEAFTGLGIGRFARSGGRRCEF